jgi:hypothetical protein
LRGITDESPLRRAVVCLRLSSSAAACTEIPATPKNRDGSKPELHPTGVGAVNIRTGHVRSLLQESESNPVIRPDGPLFKLSRDGQRLAVGYWLEAPGRSSVRIVNVDGSRRWRIALPPNLASGDVDLR